MKRTTGIAALAAAAAIGVGAAVLANALGPDSPPVTAPRTTGTVTPPPTTSTPPLPTTSPPPTTSPTSTAATTRPTTPPVTTTPPKAFGPVSAVNLLQVEDFGTVGWSTANLDTQQNPGDGQDNPGYCQAQALGSLPGSGRPFRGDINGKATSAVEIVSTFDSPASAKAAYATIEKWFNKCFDVNGIDAEKPVPVDLDSETDRATWWYDYTRTEGKPLKGGGGVVLVGQRVGLVQVYDSDPKASTMSSLMVLAAKRLSPELAGPSTYGHISSPARGMP